jgi:hypothetical protein
MLTRHIARTTMIDCCNPVIAAGIVSSASDVPR